MSDTEELPQDEAKPFDPRRHARTLYWCGWSVTQIADETGIARTTVQSWKDRGGWDDTAPVDQSQAVLSQRFNLLVMKGHKTGHDFKEIDLLGRQMTALARVRRFEGEGGHEGDLNEKVANRNAKPKKQAEKNLLDAAALAKLEAALLEGSYVFQKTWWEAQNERTRMLLKSRQIGATFHFARERLIRALKTGNNQIFISASRAQANIFKQYIIEFVQKVTGVRLRGDPLVIDRGADEAGEMLEPVTLYFLGTNYQTAQGYHGDVIIDECFWIYGFDRLFKVASAMATQARYTVTLFSTPSTINHEAYSLWSGERFNKRRNKADRVRVDISHKALKAGARGPDRIWRQIVTLQDAIASGYDLINIDDLRFEYSIEEFANLFECQFVDDSASTFPLSLLRPCMVDSWDVWRDFKPFGARPVGETEVWLGYDPNESDEGDNAALIAVTPPLTPKGKFRVIEKLQLRGLNFAAQAKKIQEWTRRYRVTEIGIDVTGVGAAVWQNVITFFPRARQIRYDPTVKSLMVHKAKSVFEDRRIEFDAGWTDLAMALMSIHPQLTKGQRQLTFVARRSAETGHADLAWALLHALFFEPLDGADSGRRSSVEFFG
jgi:uncharacterized protein YjcR